MFLCQVDEVDVTACSNETVLPAVATRARVALAPLALDLFALLRSLGEDGKRYSFSNLGSLLNLLLHILQFATPPLRLFDPASDRRTYDVNEEDSEGNSPLLLACRSNFEIAEMFVVAALR